MMIRIYLIQNLINNKVYSNANLNKNNCIKLERGIRKYGRENFIIKEIGVAQNQDKEIKYRTGKRNQTINY